MHSSGMKKHNETGKKNVIGKGVVQLEGLKEKWGGVSYESYT